MKCNYFVCVRSTRVMPTLYVVGAYLLKMFASLFLLHFPHLRYMIFYHRLPFFIHLNVLWFNIPLVWKNNNNHFFYEYLTSRSLLSIIHNDNHFHSSSKGTRSLSIKRTFYIYNYIITDVTFFRSCIRKKDEKVRISVWCLCVRENMKNITATKT